MAKKITKRQTMPMPQEILFKKYDNEEQRAENQDPREPLAALKQAVLEEKARVSALAARLSEAQDPGPQDPVSPEPDRPRNVTIPVPPLSMDLDKKK